MQQDEVDGQMKNFIFTEDLEFIFHSYAYNVRETLV